MTTSSLFLIICVALTAAVTCVVDAYTVDVHMINSVAHLRTKVSLHVRDGDDEVNNPCWEELFDDDCAMRNTYSANFVASQWIKSMPCAKGIQVRRLSQSDVLMCLCMRTHVDTLDDCKIYQFIVTHHFHLSRTGTHAKAWTYQELVPKPVSNL